MVDDDAALIARAIALATANVDQGGGPFGALVAMGGQIVAEGVNRVTADLDPTAHAEIQALRAACRARGDFQLAGAVLYSSCEPCPMCFAAAHWARVERVVFAADRHDAAAAGFDDAVLYDEIALPRDARTLAVRRCRHATARAPFDAWRRLTAKVPY